MLTGVAIDLVDRRIAAASAQALQAAIADEAIRVEPRYDAAAEMRRLAIIRIQHGTPHVTGIDGDFLGSGDFAQIRAAGAVLQGLINAGAVVRRGERRLAVSTFRMALEWLLAEARSAVSLQRYKGLGEMNAGQLWETTMDAESRTLCPGAMEDADRVRRSFLDADGRGRRAAPRVHRRERAGRAESRRLTGVHC